MVEGPSDKWGNPSSDPFDKASGQLQTVQTKFLDAVRRYAESHYLELVVHLEAPNKGYGYIQKKDGFSNLYTFYFSFGSDSATFYLGTEKATSASPDQEREARFTGGSQLQDVLDEIRRGIDEASKEVYSGLGALATPKPTLSSLQNQPANGTEASPERKNAAAVWQQDQEHARVEIDPHFRRRSRLPAMVAVLVVIAVLLLVFVPVLRTNGASASCPSTVTTQCTYYSSITRNYVGFGGEYFPAGQGWNIHAFFAKGEGVDGQTVYGFAFWQYTFAV